MSCHLIIPARAGSKGVPGKNIKLLNGKPLIAYVIEAGLKASCIDRVYVSTDGPDIAAVARDYGAQVIDRPAEISGDKDSSESAVLHALDHMDSVPDHSVFAQCTAPLTRSGDFDAAFQLYCDQDYDCLFAAKPFHGFIWREDESGAAQAVNHDSSQPRAMRQDLAPEYQETGAFYILNTAQFQRTQHRFFGKIGVYELPEERAIDIDTLEDFAAAEEMLKP